MILTPLEFINGIFTIIFVFISIIIGLKIIVKYLKVKETNFIWVGLSWMGMVSPWYPSSISFLFMLILGEELIPSIYLMIGNVIAPCTVVIWILAFMDFFYKERKRIIVSIFIIETIIYEIILFYFFFTDISLIGVVTGPIDADYSLFIIIYQIFLLIFVIITGTLFALNSLKIKKPEMKMRGKFLLIAFYSFVIGAIFDIISPVAIIILIFARFILIFSAVNFYLAFILPNWIKKVFIK